MAEIAMVPAQVGPVRSISRVRVARRMIEGRVDTGIGKGLVAKAPLDQKRTPLAQVVQPWLIDRALPAMLP